MGSDKRFEVAVFRSGVDSTEHIARTNSLITKTVTCELGSITPVIVVPGPLSNDEIGIKAINLVSGLALHAGCHRMRPRVLVQHNK